MVIAMDINPFIKDLVLIVSDTCFYFFYQDFEEPFFVSPFLMSSKFTCGKFSVSRPSVLFIGRDDGIIDIWDFAD